MSNDDRPFMSSARETALDLTVKRLVDMEDHAPNHTPNQALDMQHGMQPYGGYDRYGSYGSTQSSTEGSVSMGSEFAYDQYPHLSAPEADFQYTNGFCADAPFTQRRQTYPGSSPLPMANSSFTQHQPGSYSSLMSVCVPAQDPDSLDSYPSPGTSSGGFPYESSIIPKKRKILWRPYDSKLLLGPVGSDVEKESDSGSDSTSGSYSDQEFKTPSPPSDPVKKRKTHRSLNNMASKSEDEHPVKSGTPDTQDNTHMQHLVRDHIPRHAPAMAEKETNHQGPASGKWNTATTPSGEKVNQNRVPQTKPASNATKINAPSRNSTETREKMISGMKKRDIFGWSLKLKRPSVSVDTPPNSVTQSSQAGEQRVCTDGNKTYTELQTVKKSIADQSPEDLGASNTSKSERPESTPQQQSPVLSQQNADNQTSPTSYAEASLREGYAPLVSSHTDSDKENKESNYVSKKVYIQRRDNVIECCNEADSKTSTTAQPETKRGLSLIDLIEEIEASALVIDKDEVEKNNKKNRNIVKLLEQCNHVKLQHLDYLMANVLIQDRQRQFKCRNENVQKMLKGDKINSVNMLDVVELQVEIGLI